MRHTLIASAAVLIALFVGACSTEKEGVKSNMVDQWTTVGANTEKTTAAAKDVFEAEGLKDVTANSTAVDGKATAKKADGTKVTATVEKITDGSSKLTISVGTMGEPTLGSDLAAKIRAKAEGK